MTTDAERPDRTDRGPVGDLLRRCLLGLNAYFAKRRERLTLSCLSDDQLRDIGVTRSEARTEAGKSWFWG